VIDLVVETELGERSRTVAATDHRECLGLGHRLGNRACAGRESRILEHAHRPIPENCASLDDHVAEGGGSAGPDERIKFVNSQMEEKLGLRLQPEKSVTVDAIVIDSVEPPTPN